MKKALIALGVVAAAALPAAAFAHTNLSIGVGLGGGSYYAPPPAVVYEQPAPVYYDPPPPPPQVVYEQPGYVYGAPAVVVEGSGYYGPRYGYHRYWHHDGYRPYWR